LSPAQFQRAPLSGVEYIADVGQQLPLWAGSEEKRQRPPQELPALNPEHACGGQVGLDDATRAIQCAIAHRCPVVELRIAIARQLQCLLQVAQLAVLLDEFDLMDLQVLHHAAQFVVPRGGPG
jgi:hypothetical protein